MSVYYRSLNKLQSANTELFDSFKNVVQEKRCQTRTSNALKINGNAFIGNPWKDYNLIVFPRFICIMLANSTVMFIF